MMIKTYLPGNGFVKYMLGDPIFGEPHYGKPVDEGNDVIYFDMTSAESMREDQAGMGVTVYWNWVYDDQRPRHIGNNASINVPSLEFLITLKIIGCISRSRLLSRAQDASYFWSKIRKDCHDVEILGNLKPDMEKISLHFGRTGVDGSLAREFLEICNSQQDALDEGGSDMDKLERMLARFARG